VLCFTDRGKVYWLEVHEIPQAGRASRGKPIVNLIKIAKDEKVAAVLPVRDFVEGQYIVMCTAQGYVKKTDLMEFANPRPSGLVASKLGDDDQLIQVKLTDGQREILVATRAGLAIRFPEEAVRPMGRSARGVTAIKLKKKGDAVVGMVVLQDDVSHVLTVHDSGYGKRTRVSEYRTQGRGGSGIINGKVGDRNGPVAGVVGVNTDDEIMVVTDRGMMIRMRVKQVSEQGRPTQGVRIITVGKDETVSSVARIAESDDDDEATE
jgi:DNA gyrase subunit A